MHPLMKGIGYSVLIINLLMLSYYNTLQSYALYYLAHSFQSPLPWSSCDHAWNTESCKSRDQLGANNSSSSATMNNTFLPASEFFQRKVLGAHLSTGFNDLSHGIKPDMLLCVFFVFVLTTGCLVKGIKTSGKVVYVTALLPYICLAVLIFQSLMLDGAYEGLLYYITPQYDKLFELRVWLAAAVQIFFSLGPGFGVLTTYASYSPKNTNIKKLTIMCSLVNCITSLLYGVVVFAGLGYMAKRINKDINHFLRDGVGIVFAVYPEIIATFKFSYVYAVIFFIMLITLGMDSAFGKFNFFSKLLISFKIIYSPNDKIFKKGGMEGLYTAISDEYPICKKHSLLTRIIISSVPFITCIPTVTYAGIYVVQWMDTFAISPSVLLIVFAEVITVSWIYGLNKFCTNIKEMNDTKPFIIWRLSWKFLCPIVLFTIVLLDILFFPGLEYGSYVFPSWSIFLGYGLNVIAITPIFAYMIFYLAYKRKRLSK